MRLSSLFTVSVDVRQQATPFHGGGEDWLIASKQMRLPAIAQYGEELQVTAVNNEVFSEALLLLLAAYKTKNNSCTTIEVIRAHKFLRNKSTLLKLLPPTDAFIQHIQRDALATVIDKQSHVCEINICHCHRIWMGSHQ